MNRFFSPRHIIVITILLLLPLKAMAAPVKVAILPFNILAEKDYSFLKKGIVDMLSSRLSDPGKVEVIDPVDVGNALEGIKGLSGDNLALQVGKQVNADYTVHGSITVFGDSVSIDAKMLDLKGNRQPLTFFKQTNSMGDVIPQINLMAADINEQVFGIKSSTTAAVAAPAPAQASTPPSPQAPADIHMHPEKLLQTGQPAVTGNVATSPLAAGAALESAPDANNAFIITENTGSANQQWFWKSREYKYLINGLDVGDIDGDGLQETVVVTPRQIIIYRFSQGRQQTVKEIKTRSAIVNIGVNIGDFNKNGTPEIFVTAFSVTLKLMESYVLEFDGQAYQTIVEKSRYYYSIVDHPTLGKMLLGQMQKAGEDDTPFDAPIFEMVWKGAEYLPEQQILPAKKASVLGLAMGDLMQDKSDSFAILNPDDHLQVLSAGGKSAWKSEDVYGGTTLYKGLAPLNPGAEDQRFFLPVRVRVLDLDQNGTYEIIVPRNHDKIRRLIALHRNFKECNISALSWNGLGFSPAWRTRTIPGRIQDFTVADFDNDGVRELLMANVTKEGAWLFSKANSLLLAVDLNN